MTENVLKRKIKLRAKRKSRIRGKVCGTLEKPRVTVFRSNRYFYAQAIVDAESRTVAAVDGQKMGLKNNREDVKKIAASLAEDLKSKGIETILFDRNGYLYHGVVASFADALRANGIRF